MTPDWEAVLTQALEAGAGDILLAPGQVPLCNIQGYWLTLSGAGPLESDTLSLWLEDMAGDARRRALRESGGAAIVRPWGSDGLRLRAIVHSEARGLAAAIRFIPAEPPSLAHLQAPNCIAALLEESSGLILIGGAAGSGRSTLLAGALEHINASYTRRIACIGAPPEFAFTRKRSSILTLDSRDGMGSVSHMLRALRFHDLDVIAIDTILAGDDLFETLLLAQSGTLVLLLESGMSAKSALRGLVERLPSARRRQAQGILADSLRGAVFQVLVKRADGQGRLPAHEILLQSRSLCDPLREGRWDSLPKIMTTARSQGMRTLDDTLDDYLRQNWIAGAEALQHALDKSRFAQFGPPEWRAAPT